MLSLHETYLLHLIHSQITHGWIICTAITDASLFSLNNKITFYKEVKQSQKMANQSFQ